MKVREVASIGLLKVFADEIFKTIDICLYERYDGGIRVWESTMPPESAYDFAKSIMEAAEEMLE